MSQLAHATPEPFRFTVTNPYDTFINGQPAPVPYIVSGLLTQGGLSIFGGKPKSGKSSMSRYLAACVAAGRRFLDRDTEQGDVILFNLEDPQFHVANCLMALGHDPKKHGQIVTVEKLPFKFDESIDALGDLLAKSPDVRLVIIDHLAKFLNVSDLGEYIPVQQGFQKLHSLARQYPHLHIQALAHCKKVQPEDPFDGILGSTALRGEPDTNIIVYLESGRRIIATETRVGVPIPKTIINGRMVESSGAEVVSDYALQQELDLWKTEQSAKKEAKQKASYQERIISFLSECENQTAQRSTIMDEVEGRAGEIGKAITELEELGIITITKEKGRGTPQTVRMDLNSTCGGLASIGRSN